MTKPIEIQSLAVDALLTQLHAKLDDMSPLLQVIGEDMIERTKLRFVTATGPDGVRWQPNAQVTLVNYLQKKGGFSKKTGKITAKGQQLVSGKRPLQGQSGDLARQFSYRVLAGTQLTVASSMVYAAMQQYGGTKAKYPKLWGDIPARQFFPVQADGQLYPDEENKIVDRLREYLSL
ncbi:phage virion morphogenesis protein [Undibacterium sp. TJN25]|uniref:phage virion morphogenesis protein n=1 Tax=Undibacterium sp. TJN25 TaxID=3413056 RepID=UPI003BF03533